MSRLVKPTPSEKTSADETLLANPKGISGSKVLQELHRKIEEELRLVEQHIFTMETAYFTHHSESLLKGWEALFHNKPSKCSSYCRSSTAQVKSSDRIFTSSSCRKTEDGEACFVDLRHKLYRRPAKRRKDKDDYDFSEF